MSNSADTARAQATRYLVNRDFNQAVLFFRDGSYLQFEHKSRQDRWAQPSTTHCTAEKLCQSLHQFRLNAKHLQLYFEDGSNIEFIAESASTPK